MKKNFLVTTGLVDTWEFNETNFLLGKWCELYEFSDFNKKQFVEKIPTKIVFERIENRIKQITSDPIIIVHMEASQSVIESRMDKLSDNHEHYKKDHTRYKKEHRHNKKEHKGA